MEAMTWSAEPMASTPRKPTKLTAARQRKGSARGSKRSRFIAVSPRDAAPPGLWIVRPRLPTYVSSFQPTVIFLDEAGNRHIARQCADEKRAARRRLAALRGREGARPAPVMRTFSEAYYRCSRGLARALCGRVMAPHVEFTDVNAKFI